MKLLFDSILKNQIPEDKSNDTHYECRTITRTDLGRCFGPREVHSQE